MTVNLLIHESDTTGGTSRTTAATATPTANALLVVCARGTASTTLTISDSGSHSWTERTALSGASTAKCWTALEDGTPGAISITVGGDAGATGYHITLLEQPNPAASPFVQAATWGSGAGSVDPSAVFAAAPILGNTVIGFAYNVTNPAGIVPPGGGTPWNEVVDSGHASPNAGVEIVWWTAHANATVQWGDTPSAWQAGAIELLGQIGSASGSGTATGVGKGTARSAASASGVGAATGIGKSTARSTAAASGIGAATAVGKSTASATAAASGTGVATGVGVSVARSTAAASGAGTAAGIGKSTARSVGSAAGIGEATAVGTTVGAGSVGAASGTGTATAIGKATARSAGSASGTGAATAVSVSTARSVGVAAGAGTATGIAGTGADEADAHDPGYYEHWKYPSADKASKKKRKERDLLRRQLERALRGEEEGVVSRETLPMVESAQVPRQFHHVKDTAAYETLRARIAALDIEIKLLQQVALAQQNDEEAVLMLLLLQ